MSSGRLGAADIAAATNTVIYTAPAGGVATVSVNISNRNSLGTNILVRLAFINGGIGALSDADYVEYDTQILSGEVLERTGIVMAAGQTIVIYSDLASVSAQVWGWEETT